MVKSDRLKQVNLVPNFITAFGLARGLFVILKSTEIKPDFDLYGFMHSALILLLIAALADFLDGAVARAIRAETEFGFLFDTLSDAITFGVAPAVLSLKYLSQIESNGKWHFLSLASSMVFAICGVLRLVRFQILTRQSRGNQQEEFKLKKSFVGLPIPAAAIAFTAFILFLSSSFSGNWPELIKLCLLNGYGLFLGYLMVSRWKFPALKNFHFKVPSFDWIFFSVILAIGIFYGVLYYLPIGVLVLANGYLFFGIILTILRLVQMRRFARKINEKK